MLHPAEAGEIDQVVPPGRGSEGERTHALSVPVLIRQTVNPAWSPAETLVASGILVMETSPQFTATSAWAPPEPSLVVVKVAALCGMYPPALHDALPIWTEVEAPPARVAGP